MPNSNVSSGIYAGLIAVAQMFVTKMFAKIDANRLPAAIKTATSIGQVKQSANSSSIDVEIDLKTAPMAAAFEWGSGIHSRKEAKTYRIPKEGKYGLAFDWEGHTADYPKGRKYKGEAKDGRLVFSYVDHPGVAAQPYITPALVEIMPEAKKKLAQEIKAAILIGVERVSYIKA